MSDSLELDFAFNYHGEDMYNNANIQKIIVRTEIDAFENNHLIQHNDLPLNSTCPKYCDCVKVFYDPKDMFRVEKNPVTYDYFRIIYGISDIKIRPIGGYIRVEGKFTEVEFAEYPEFASLPAYMDVPVSIKELKTFMQEHINNITNKDNGAAYLIRMTRCPYSE